VETPGSTIIPFIHSLEVHDFGPSLLKLANILIGVTTVVVGYRRSSRLYIEDSDAITAFKNITSLELSRCSFESFSHAADMIAATSSLQVLSLWLVSCVAPSAEESDANNTHYDSISQLHTLHLEWSWDRDDSLATWVMSSPIAPPLRVLSIGYIPTEDIPIMSKFIAAVSPTLEELQFEWHFRPDDNGEYASDSASPSRNLHMAQKLFQFSRVLRSAATCVSSRWIQ